ncbi:relaxase/mobilization nuclease domain-containing protein [Sunxiuqinia indica]|uniref:relaxase/mobilization nuclease domain-containing protein n=1 Tax=Sunxiuqinia indica TaxID=2692584 RepID=UPI001358E78D|nr:relaxase/mobilization nuclease domain-containing protein [Sunxiuqinia indica]
MMAKIVKGQDFRGVVNYVLDKEKGTQLLESQGVRLKDRESIIQSFAFQSEMNPRIKKPVGHISLDFSAKDKQKLDNRLMVEVSREYMQRMGIENTQYIVARHYDKEHPHVHLIFNRVDNTGRTISDRNDRYRSEKICKELTTKYGLYFAKGKENVKVQRLKEPDKTKYEIYEALKNLIPQCQNWDHVIGRLKEQNITVDFKFRGKTSEIQGVSFIKNGYSFNGSKVDRQFSYSKITFQMKQNLAQQMKLDHKAHAQISDRMVAGNFLASLIYKMGKYADERKQWDKKHAIPKIKRRKGLRR